MDRGKPGSKMHVLSDANGLPLLVGVFAANVHDSLALKPVVTGHQTTHDPHRGRYFKPQRLHADKAYDVPHLRRWLRGKRIGVRIARKGVESSERLGRRRWVIERTMSWLTGYRRLNHRYERHPATTWPFSASPQPCAATSDSPASPHRTRSECDSLWWPHEALEAATARFLDDVVAARLGLGGNPWESRVWADVIEAAGEGC